MSFNMSRDILNTYLFKFFNNPMKIFSKEDLLPNYDTSESNKDNLHQDTVNILIELNIVHKFSSKQYILNNEIQIPSLFANRTSDLSDLLTDLLVNIQNYNNFDLNKSIVEKVLKV